jgi:hypothetical protein
MRARFQYDLVALCPVDLVAKLCSFEHGMRLGVAGCGRNFDPRKPYPIMNAPWEGSNDDGLRRGLCRPESN